MVQDALRLRVPLGVFCFVPVFVGGVGVDVADFCGVGVGRVAVGGLGVGGAGAGAGAGAAGGGIVDGVGGAGIVVVMLVVLRLGKVGVCLLYTSPSPRD